MPPSTSDFTSKKPIHNSKKYSVFYHSIFDYPLTKQELNKWQTGPLVKRFKIYDLRIMKKNNFYFIKGKEGTILKRIAREKYSGEKLVIAKSAAKILSKIPTIKMIGITGALAMKNADDESDIDLIFITKKRTLWITRLISYSLLFITRFKLRRPKDASQKDKLCLNMWLDESDLVIKKRNIFTAHEIAQILPLVNKEKIYERFLYKNRWILGYWPKATSIKYKVGSSEYKTNSNFIYTLYMILNTVLEPFAYSLQRLYMQSKITMEIVTPTRAFFHPFDWSKFMEGILK